MQKGIYRACWHCLRSSVGHTCLKRTGVGYSIHSPSLTEKTHNKGLQWFKVSPGSCWTYMCAQLSIAKTYVCDNHSVTWTSVALNCFDQIVCQVQVEVHVKSQFMKSAGHFIWNTELQWVTSYDVKRETCTGGRMANVLRFRVFVYSCPSDPEAAALEAYSACIRSHAPKKPFTPQL